MFLALFQFQLFLLQLAQLLSLYLFLLQLKSFLLAQLLPLFLFLLQLQPFPLLQLSFFLPIQFFLLCHYVFLFGTKFHAGSHEHVRACSFTFYNFGNRLTTFAAVAGRSITPPWWMKIGVSTAV